MSWSGINHSIKASRKQSKLMSNKGGKFLKKLSKETMVLRRWEYYKIIWFYQLSWQCKLATVKRFANELMSANWSATQANWSAKYSHLSLKVELSKSNRQSIPAPLILTCFHSDRTEEKLRGEYLNSVALVICRLIGLIEDKMKEGQPLGLTCSSLQDVNDPFIDNSWPQLLHQHISREGTR